METLLTTKLYIPQVRPHLLPRPHLFERLQQGLWGRLTLVSAPPGFGKTTLVSSWAAQCRRPVAWLSLDAYDSAPTRFLSYLVAALQTIRPDIGRSLTPLLDAPTLPPAQQLLPPLINELATPAQDLLLVLDDYHLIQTGLIHEIVTFLIDHMPPAMHLILTSRADPPLPLARWRARGQLTEIRTNDLRFSSTETTHLFEQASHHLSSAETLALEEQLEGWAAGLQMALLSLRGRQTVAADTPPILTGRHPYILDYLADEVLHQQPKAIQYFLLQTSILDRLSGPLCDAVLNRGAATPSPVDELSLSTAMESGQAILEYLEQANLFIVPLDDRRHWYRYHHLFADFLRNQLQKQTATDSRWPTPETLHRRAAAWYEQHGPNFNALEHALAADDLDWAARLVERQGELLLMRRTFSTLRDWLERLPAAVIRSRPRLAVLNFWLLLFSGEFQQAEPYLPLAEAQAASQDDLAVEGRVAAAQAFLLAIRKEPGQAIERCQHMLAKLPASEAIVRGQLTLQLGIAHEFNEDLSAADQVYQEAQQTYQKLGLLPMEVWVNSRLGWGQFLRGQLHQAETTYRHTLQTVAESEETAATVTGWIHIGLGRLLYEQNHLAEAERHLTLGIDWSQQELDRGMALIGYVYLAWIRYAQGDVEAAHQYFAQVNDWTENNRATRSDGFIAAHQTRLRLRLDDLAIIPAWLESYRAGRSDLRSAPLAYTHLRELEDLTLAQVRLAQDQPEQALPILSRCLTEAQAAQRQSSVIEIWLLQALTRHTLGETDEALSSLETTLRLAESEGYVRTVLDVGPALATLLPQIGPESGVKPYAVKLLGLFDAAESSSRSPTDPLTDRELEVLHLLANGHSNREIAERLVISIGTVAKHTHNIFTKLEADNRAHAVTRAQSLGLM